MVTDAGNQVSLLKALCEAYRDFERFGLSSGSAGNVSVRWTGGMLISPAGATAASAAPEAFVVMSLDGDVLSTGKPSSEWAMHAEIIGARRTPGGGSRASRRLHCAVLPTPCHAGLPLHDRSLRRLGHSVFFLCAIRVHGIGSCRCVGAGGAHRVSAGQSRHDLPCKKPYRGDRERAQA
jgi:hypothetical protein